MLIAALWACLQASSVEELARRASLVGVAEVQSVFRDELRLRFSETWKGTSFGAFALEKPIDFLRIGERVIVFAGGVERGRHPVLALFRGDDERMRREGDRFSTTYEFKPLKERIFNALGKELPPDPPKKKPAPPPDEADSLLRQPPAEDPIDGLLPWGFGLAGALIAAGGAWLWAKREKSFNT